MSTAALTPQHYPEIHRRLGVAVRRVCPAWLSPQADDLVQVAMLKVVRALEEGGGEANTAFLYRVAHCVVVDEIRKARRRREDTLTPSWPDRVSTGSAGPDTLTSGRQLGEVILECLGELHEDRRRAVTLHLQGHTVPETGRLLGFNEKKAENLVYRGLADLREGLKRKGVSP